MTAVHDPVRAEAIARATPDGQADLAEAAELVIRSGLGSWKMLQRKMRLNQADAEAILETLEQAGIVGPEIAGQRRVLVKAADLDTTLAALESSPVQPSPDVQPEPVQDPAGQSSPDSSDPPSETSSPGSSSPAVPLGKPSSRPAPPASSPGTALEPRPSSPPAQRPAGDMEEADEELQPRQRVIIEAVQKGGRHVVTAVYKGDNRWTRTSKRGARMAWTTGQGAVSWARRATTAANHGHAREQLRMARLAGDPDAVEKWLQIISSLRTTRIARLKALPSAMAGLGLAILVAVSSLAMLAVLAGVLAWIAWGGHGWTTWWWLAGWAGYLAAALVVLLAALTLMLAVPVTLLAAHREGSRVAEPPRWMLSSADRRVLDALITPARVAMALRDCGIPELRKYIKESPDGGGELLGQISPAGKGVEVDVRPPPTVSTAKLLEKRRALAEAMDRHEHELHMTIVAARTVRFWIADPGALDEPIGQSPLVTAGPKAIKANMKTGKAPWGENLRGDVVGVSLYQRHLTIAGLSNHGKTAAARALLLWLAYDVNVDFWIADLKGVGDWDMFGPINGAPGLASVYIAGPTDDHVIQATEMLEAAVAEMERRLQEGKDNNWPDLVVAVDEAQLAYMCPAVDQQKRPYGGAKNTSRFFLAARKIHNQGRAVNVTLHEYFQDPTDQNFPEIVREGAHIRICLVVGTASKSKMALGEAAVEGGAAPHLLRRDIDKGAVVMHGGVDIPRGESSITLRTYFIDDPEAWQLARGAIEKRRKAGKTPLVIEGEPAVVIDSLMDMYRAMNSENRVKTTVVLSRMREENPAVYEDWSAQDFADTVNEYAHLGLGIRKYGGDRVLRIEEVEQALRERG